MIARRGSTDNPARFNEPGGLSLAGSTLFVADTNNHRIRAVDVATKDVKTLDLSTVKPAVRARTPSFANPTVFNLAPVQAMPGRELKLDVALDLPPGYKLSTQAPLVYLVEADRPDVFGPEVSPTGQKVDQPGRREFLLRLPLARQAPDRLEPPGEVLRLRLRLPAELALHGQELRLERPDHVRWRQPDRDPVDDGDAVNG